MERKQASRAGNSQTENNVSKPELWESEIVFGPHREVLPGEVYDPEDLTVTYKLLPIRKYGRSPNENKSGHT